MSRIQHPITIVPEKRIGCHDSTEAHRIFSDERTAAVQYTTAVSRLLNIGKWEEFTGSELEFTLTDPQGVPVNRLPKKDDLVRSRPIASFHEEDVEWLAIDDYYERHDPDMAYDLFALRLRLVEGPVNGRHEILAEDEKAASKTFIVQRSGTRLTAAEKTRNEPCDGKVFHNASRFAEPCETGSRWQLFIEHVLG